MNVQPLEQSDPELADYFKQIANGKLNAKVYRNNVYKTDNSGNIIVETILSQPKIGRNDPCSCGSGKKYKKCCGKV